MRRPEPSVEVRIMPELPEIETIKSIVEPQIQGLAIENVPVYLKKTGAAVCTRFSYLIDSRADLCNV